MTDVNDYNWIKPVEYETIAPSVREYDDFDWDAAIEYNQRLRLMWAYNDKFYRGAVKVERSEFDIRVARWDLVHLTKFYDDHLEIQGDCPEKSVDYTDIRHVLFSKNLMILVCRDKMGIILSLNGFTVGDPDTVRDLITAAKNA
jgi:hypothetical protein